MLYSTIKRHCQFVKRELKKASLLREVARDNVSLPSVTEGVLNINKRKLPQSPCGDSPLRRGPERDINPNKSVGEPLTYRKILKKQLKTDRGWRLDDPLVNFKFRLNLQSNKDHTKLQGWE